MSYPRKYPISTGAPLDENDWNAVVDYVTGYTTVGVIEYPYTNLVRINGGKYEALNNNGTLVYGGADDEGTVDGDDCSAVVQACIEAAATAGTPCVIQFTPGTFTLTDAVTINSHGVTVRGASAGGDIYFTNDATYKGFYNRHATSFIANGINAFEVGEDAFTLATTFENFGVHGTVSDAAQDDDVYSAGAGIRIFRCDTLRIRDVQVQRKQYGLHLEESGVFAFDNVIDAVFLRDLYFSFNVYGIYMAEWMANVRAENIYGYINQKSLIRCDSQIRYDARFRNIYSNADSWNAADNADAPLSFNTSRDLHLDGVYVAGGYGEANCPTPLIYLYLTKFAAEEAHRAYVRMSDVILAETDEEGIYIDGDYGMVVIRDLYAGSTGTQSWHGGSGEITKAIVYNAGTPETEFYVYGGLADCELATKSDWYYGGMKIRDVGNYCLSNHGTDVSSGNGVDDTVIIAHSLVTTPTKFGATAASSDARLGELRGVVADATNLTVYFTNALTNGTNNISINWWAEADAP